MARRPYLTAEEACAELGVAAQTLYAYVSRGLIRSEPGVDGSRGHRYRAEDVLRLKERKRARRDPDTAARDALRWGAPLLESALTWITDGRLYYRGEDAVQLARSCTVEEVAALLWTGSRDVPDGWFDEPAAEVRVRENVGPLAALQIELALAEAKDPSAHDVRPERVAATGMRVLRRLARVAGGGGSAEGNISELLQRAWAPHRPEAEPLLRAALILLADHELNVASFTARCVASAGSTPYAAVSAGIGAMHGVRHARHVERVEALFAEVERPERAGQVLEARLRRGERVPGFGHRLHPSGDPRATELLRQLREVDPHSPGLALADAIEAAAEPLLDDRPTFEIGLVALARAMELPEGAPLMLFVLGRSLGLVAHAVEQYGSREVLRPRARYMGAMPPE
ncbi:citrate/2-methylcitrate synthase [Longimicrobium terrae]|uniref:citrate synthase (unknown stereospecificity) n=1 Tax=Longimicrobium terrae TaxID=1639882 RepID=A0A841GN25_9BACT|nr:citrate synthase [Longimicrobium terrae]MBB6068712.1 citrate synthase [Longimicrobium terrae]NNC27898.1 helix-turn-helix domain-containing protein [Longimicrobium terrae]